MKSRNIRFTTALVTFGLFIALAGLIAPSAIRRLGGTHSSFLDAAAEMRQAGADESRSVHV